MALEVLVIDVAQSQYGLQLFAEAYFILCKEGERIHVFKSNVVRFASQLVIDILHSCRQFVPFVQAEDSFGIGVIVMCLFTCHFVARHQVTRLGKVSVR